MDPNDIKNAHLLFFVYNFIVNKTMESHWTFRNPEKGEPYWINHYYKRISGEYPFVKELTLALKMHKDNIQFKARNSELKNLGTLKRIFGSKTEKEAISQLCEIRRDFAQL